MLNIWIKGRIMNSRKILAWLMFVGLLSFSFMNSGMAQPGSNGDVKIVVISDLNEAYGETAYSRQVHDALLYIAEQMPDLVICAGDMVAGQNLKLSEENLQAMWQGFNTTILQPLNTLRIPFVFTFGNHDGANSKSFVHERRIAREFWEKNRPDLTYIDNSCFPHYYSFEFKGIFFASLDASAAKIDQQQIDWLKAQLAGEVAKKARLRLILGHLPLYPITQGRNAPGNVLGDADSLQTLFNRLGVDYYISGHHHAFYLSSKGNLKMLSAGALGGGPRKILNSDRPPVKTLTVLQLKGSDKDFQITTHDMTSSRKVIFPADLPAEIPGYNGTSRLFPW